jgi:hypothetical protein
MKLDDSLKNGPVMKRRMTDVFFCLFFIVFIFGMVAVYAYAFTKGRPALIVQGWDSDGLGCGLNTTTKDYPVLYWPEVPGIGSLNSTLSGNYSAIFQTLNHGVCVKECPTKDSKIECRVTARIAA